MFTIRQKSSFIYAGLLLALSACGEQKAVEQSGELNAAVNTTKSVGGYATVSVGGETKRFDELNCYSDASQKIFKSLVNGKISTSEGFQVHQLNPSVYGKNWASKSAVIYYRNGETSGYQWRSKGKLVFEETTDGIKVTSEAQKVPTEKIAENIFGEVEFAKPTPGVFLVEVVCGS